MDYKQIAKLFLAGLVLSPLHAVAQSDTKVQVEAVVRTADGKPVAGAVVSGDDRSAYAITGEDGSFSVNVSPTGAFVVKAAGYKDMVVKTENVPGEIVMYPIADDELVNVAFRKVQKRDLMGGVSYINLPDFMKKDYTTYSLDGLQSYIGGYTGNVWGQGALVLIDGVPRDASSDIRPSEIEQITVLKGVGAVALYGSRGAKGVVMITTKRGEAHDRQINVRANTGFYVPKSYPKYLSSWEYMTLYNEALRNDGLTELYDDYTIYQSFKGDQPYRYPNVDFYSDDYLKKAYNKSDLTAEFSGGNDKAQFYTNIGVEHQNTLLNFGEGKNESLLRFNARGNVDFKFNDILSASVDASVVVNNNRFANGDFYGAASTLRPNRVTPLIPVSMFEDGNEELAITAQNSSFLIDGKYLLGGTQQDQTNAIADVYAGGYNKSNSRQFQLTAALDFNLNKLLEGLSFRAQYAIDYSSSYSETYTNQYAVYAPSWYTKDDAPVINSLTQYGEDRKDGTQKLGNSWYQQTQAFSGQFNYVKTVDDVHNLSAMLLAAAHQRTESAVYHKTSNANLGLMLAYNYDHKYYADFSSALVHSAKMAPRKRNAFSPTLSLGWRLSEEAFLEDSPVVDDLRITASAGILHTDLDFTSFYMYKGYYTQTEGAWYAWKDDASKIQSTDSRRGENPDLGFVKRKEVNVGFEASLFKRFVTMNANFYINRMEGMPVQPSTVYPVWFSTGWPNSSFIPYVNYNIDRRMGVDFAVNFNKKFGEFDLALGLTGNYLTTEAIKRDELYEDTYRNRVGRPIDSLWGLESAGFYESEEDIANYGATSSYGEVKPGDIKYVDQNHDGVIDDKDEIYLGNAGWSGAPFAFGINLTAKWRNFTLFARGTGNVGTYGIKSSSYYWVYGDRKYSEVVLNRWTPETASTATYPRLTTLNGDNNFRNSDFWLYKANRFDLAKVQLTYDFPLQMLKKSFVRELGVYVSGENLLTISKERKLMEMTVGGTPQCRLFNLGVKASF